MVQLSNWQPGDELRPRTYDGAAADVAFERHQVSPKLAPEQDRWMQKAAEAQRRGRQSRFFLKPQQPVAATCDVGLVAKNHHRTVHIAAEGGKARPQRRGHA